MNLNIRRVGGTTLDGYSALLSYALAERIEKDAEAYLILGAEADGAPCGILAASEIPDGVRLHELRVDSAFRGAGVGDALFRGFVAGTPPDRSADEILCAFTPETTYLDDDPGYAFLRRFDFSFEAAEGGTFVTRVEDLEDLSFFAEPPPPSDIYVPLSRVPERSIQAFNKQCAERLNLASPLYPAAGVLPNASRVAVVNGSVEGIVVLSERNGAIELSWLYGAAKAGAHLPSLLKTAYHEIREDYPAAELYIPAANAQSIALAKKLCPNAMFLPFLEARGQMATCRAIIEARKLFETALAAGEEFKWE